MHTDRPVLGILLMIGFCIVAPMGDAVAKLLGGHVGLGQLITVRFAAQVVLLLPLVAMAGMDWSLPSRVWHLVWLRTALHILGIGMMFAALQYLPLADAVAIAFVLPFIMLLLGHLVLKEEVGPRRLIACAVGFGGTLLVVQPAFVSVGWPALLPLGVALNFAVFMLVTRQIAREMDPVSLQAVSGCMAVVILVPLMLLVPAQAVPALAWAGLDAGTWALLLLLGFFGTLAHLLMTWSLKFAPSATLAPIQYLEIPFATAIGWLVFSDLPNGMATVGIVITIAAGLYILLREQATAKARAAAPPTTGPTPAAAE